MKRLAIALALLLSVVALSQPAYHGNYTEPYRLQFHFTPQQKWMNDPNGLVYHNGKYHLFYQYYPNDIVWGPMHWGHAVSTDLLHWKHLPIALYPDSLGWIFSGSAVIDKNNTAGFGKNAMVAIFTYHNDEIWKQGRKNTESQGIAYSNDEGITWKKYSGNPVLNNSGEQDFRDPKVFWNEQINKWNMVLAVGDRIKIFSSSNLKEWKWESDFKPADDLKQLGTWECPDLFSMKDKFSSEERWVMIVNHDKYAPNGGSGGRYFVGTFDGKTFTNDQPSKWLDNGTDFYAAVTFGNVPDNKRILLAWMSNWQYATKVPTEVWRSAMTLPRELSLKKTESGFVLYQQPVAQMAGIRKMVYSKAWEKLPFSRNQLDLSQAEVSFNISNAEEAIITLSNSKGECYTVSFKDNQLIADRSKSGKTSFSDLFANKVQTMNLEGERISHIQLILDKSSIEVLINGGRFSFTNLFFPDEPWSAISIQSPRAEVFKLSIRKIKSVWTRK